MSGDRLQRILVWLLIAAVGVFLLERLFVIISLFATPLLLFGLAWLFSLILQPLVAGMTRLTFPRPRRPWRASIVHQPPWRLPRNVAVLLVYLAMIALISFLAISLAPVIGTQLVNLQATLPSAVHAIPGWASDIEREFNRLGWHVNLERALQPDALAQQAAAVGSAIIQQSLGFVSGIAVLLINVVLVLILSFYMTLDGPRLTARFVEILPDSWHADTLAFFTIVDRTFGGFLRAQFVQSLFYGVATAVLMMLFGLSDVALASVLAALLVLIPLVGGLFAVILPLLLTIIEVPDRLIFMVLGLIIIQQVLFNIIMPRLMGQIVGLHPLLVLAAILLGATLAGTWGVLFGIPIAGVIASVLHFLSLRTTARRAAMMSALPHEDDQVRL